MSIKSFLFILPAFVLFTKNLSAQTSNNVIAFYFATGIAADSKGNLFVIGKNHKIIKITPDGKAQDFAGSPRGHTSHKDGAGANAMFVQTTGIAIDEKDNLLIADYRTIRKVTPEGIVTTIYGNPNKGLIKDDHKNTATFYRLGSITVDREGTLYVTDKIFDTLQNRSFNIIRKISLAGYVHTIKNSDGSVFRSHTIEGLACDKDGNLYVSAVAWSSCIKKISPDETITTVAGVYNENPKNRSYFAEGDIQTARIVKPVGIAINQTGEVFFSDPWIHRILKVANNRVTIVAGGGGKSANGISFMSGSGSGGYADGKGKQALLSAPYGITLDKSGNLYFIDGNSANNHIRKLSPDGMVTTFYKYEWNPVTKQYEDHTLVTKIPEEKIEKKPEKTALDKQLDSIFNDPALKKILKDAKALNIDSVKRATEKMTTSGGVNTREKDTSAYVLPGKNIKALAKIPKEILSPAELKSYATNLYKKLAPAFHSSYGTPLVNTDAYDANTISNSSVLASETGHLDQAVLLSLKAVEKNPGDPATLNNAGAVLKKGGLEIAAVTVLEVANQKAPDNSTVQNNLGQAYLSLGDKQKGEQYLQRCISNSPNHPLANSSLALINHAKGNKQTALKFTENSLRGGFTDRAWHLLYKLKPDATLMDYFRHRYKQPEYFNEDKYKLPMQCEKVTDIPAKRAEYEAYHEMVTRVKAKFDAISKEEMEAATNSMKEKAKKGQLIQSPFMQLASAMMLDLTLQMNKSGEWEKVGKSQQQYREQISLLQEEYKKKRYDADGCGAQIALANEYMGKMSAVTREYQKIYLRTYKDFYHDMTYWSFFSSADVHFRKGAFCAQARGLLGVLLQLAETHFLDVSIDCASNEKLKKEAEDIKIQGECPMGEDGYEIPFGIGKFSLSCERWELEIGEGLVLNVGHKFTSGETIWALGPGVALSIIGSDAESIKQVPQLKLGPIKPGLSAGIKGQVFLTFRNGALLDWGGLFETELDLLGVAKEFKTGYTIGMNAGLEMQDGPLKNLIDKTLGPEGEAPQINKNVRPYRPQ